MRARFVLLVVVSLLFAACGSDEGAGDASGEPQAADTQGSFPVSVDAPNSEVTLDERPERIVSLSPTATEMLFAIDAGDQVEAVDDQSNYPADVPVTDLSGFEPNVEAVAAYEPDLVVIANDLGDIVASLDAIDVPVLLQPAAADLNDTYSQIEQLGVLTGHVAEAAELVASMQSDIDEVVSSVPELASAPTYYHELDDTYFTATSETFIGRVYGLFGLENIADEAAKASSGYVQLSEEYIIDANPEMIFLADTKCCGITAATVEERPGWDRIAAVTNGAVVELDDDVASRWGPRVVDYIRVVGGELSELAAAGY